MARRPIAYVLAATDHGPMIVNRFDYGIENGQHFMSVGLHVLQEGSCASEEIVDTLGVIALRYLRHGRGVVVLDGGANMGTHTVEWARAMRGWGSVIAIEPQERTYYALCGNIALNNLFNARAICAALGDAAGSVIVPSAANPESELFPTGGVSLRNWEKAAPNFVTKDTPGVALCNEVPVITIDSLGLQRLDVMKLDLEGGEPDALDGARDTIARLKPVVVAEWQHVGDDAITSRLPDYVFNPIGQNLLCVHKDDPVLPHLHFVDREHA